MNYESMNSESKTCHLCEKDAEFNICTPCLKHLSETKRDPDTDKKLEETFTKYEQLKRDYAKEYNEVLAFQKEFLSWSGSDSQMTYCNNCKEPCHINPELCSYINITETRDIHGEYFEDPQAQVIEHVFCRKRCRREFYKEQINQEQINQEQINQEQEYE